MNADGATLAPAGVATFRVTDIEGSTRMWRSPEVMLGEDAFSEAFLSGRTMELDDAIDYALSRKQGGAG